MYYFPSWDYGQESTTLQKYDIFAARSKLETHLSNELVIALQYIVST